MAHDSDSTGLASYQGRALGTDVRVVVTRPQGLAIARTAVDRVLADIDQACSRFREDSELSRLNSLSSRNLLHAWSMSARTRSTAVLAMASPCGRVTTTRTSVPSARPW